MSVDDSSSISSSSSENSNTISWNQRLNEFHQWQTRLTQQNRQIDVMVEDDFTSNPYQFIQPQSLINRAPRRYYERNREEGHQRLFHDYFSDNPIYPSHIFRRRFRMQKHVFMRIVDTLSASDEYFQQKHSANGRMGFSPLQKCTAAMRVLAYGASYDVVDEYLRMSEAVVRTSLKKFVTSIVSIFGDQYLRKPSEQDLARLLHVGEQRGFPGMMGIIDCMHWEWKNCPTAWAGQYVGRSGKTTIILEALASFDLWIWHAFFGTPGSCNDINVLQRSPVFKDILEGKAPKVCFIINGHQYNMGYYLTDGIYPSWTAFVKSITAPQLQKHKLFAQHQEAARKDVERTFGVLQSQFAFIKRPCLVWDDRVMGKILMACIILHNMIVEDERETYQNYFDTTEFTQDQPTQNETEVVDNETFQFSNGVSSLSSYMVNRAQLHNREINKNLQNDLIEHISNKFGNHS